MSMRIPLGEAEGTRLEFKSSEALRRPERIAREVVAMLNADGGEVWVGLRDEGGVALEIEPVAEPERTRDALRDALVDRIEPPPAGDEVEIEVVGEPPATVLRVVARPRHGRRPYAVRSRDGRLFLTRVGSRNRPLERDELQALFSPRAGGEIAERPPADDAPLRDDLKRMLASPRSLIWVGVTAPPGGELDLKAVAESPYLVEPASIGGAGEGLGFLNTFYAAHFLAQRQGTRYLRPSEDGWLVAGAGEYRLWLSEQGELRAEAPLEKFLALPEDPHHTRFPEMVDREALDPKALTSYPLSVLRLLSAFLRDRAVWASGSPDDAEGAAAVTLVGVEGWYLEPGPDHPLRVFPVDPLRLRLLLPEVRERPAPAESNAVTAGPKPFSLAELRDEPDRCTYRLLRGIFAAFGYGEEQIPYFDRRTGRFDL